MAPSRHDITNSALAKGLFWASCLALFGLLVGCRGAPGGLPQTQRQTPEEVLRQALTLLREAVPSQATYTNAVQQLNTYLSLLPPGKINWSLSEEVKAVARELTAGLPPRSIKRPSGEEEPFTQEYQIRTLEQLAFDRVDAGYLNRAFLFQDAVEELLEDVAPIPREAGLALQRWQRRFAEHAFSWCMRQVQYEPNRGAYDSWPAHEVLRRGTGDAEERALVFLALLEQTDLVGCVVLRPSAESFADSPLYSYWLTGVLVGDDLLLFDTARGEMLRQANAMPLTLRQLLREPQLIQFLPESLRLTSDVLQQLRLGLFTELPGLSPKMKQLEEWLGEARKVRLHVNLADRKQRLEQAQLNIPIIFWRDPQRSWFPSLTIARFVVNPLNQPRYQPRIVVETDYQGRMRVKFLDGPIVPRTYWTPQWAMEIAERLPPYAADRLFRTFDNLILRVRTEPGGPRDLLVRGQVLQALAALEQLERDMDEKLATFYRRMGGDFSTTGNEDPVLVFRNKWAPEVIRLYQQFELRRAQTPPGTRDPILTELTTRIEALWRQHTATLYYLNYDWATPELLEQIAYLTALGRLDLAIHLEMRLPEDPSPARLEEVKREYETALYWLKRYQALMATRSRRQWERAVAHLLPLAERGALRLHARLRGEHPPVAADALPYLLAAGKP
ncbi:MAG: hypothetical protein RMI91_13180 [Gemmatales bacterium]|nr:hypothetical protein [Gemmatales bacterium]MDW7995597.1 hypothetical protein [Gemmatales bacterium]